MTEQHPITPPPELVKQWVAEIWHEGTPVQVAADNHHIATQAAQWGADQELEACCEWLVVGQWFSPDGECLKDLRAARRPKAPSLKEQALALINGCTDPHGDHLDDSALDTIRRALNELPNE